MNKAKNLLLSIEYFTEFRSLLGLFLKQMY